MSQFLLNGGNILLATAFMLSVAASIFLFRGKDGNSLQLNAAKKIYYISAIFILIALVHLLIAILSDDFRFLYVYSNSERAMPLLYKIAALWAGNEGSFLVWLAMMSFFGIFIAREKDDFDYVVFFTILIAQIFILLVLFFKNPFTYIWNAFPGEIGIGQAPPDGSGMNPLLMDPWMVAHPPVLFVGYASSVVICGYALSALVKGEYDLWIKKSYTWLIVSSLFLGAGIFMGGYWAYKVLGWGGYWGWDPVENSSLVPWLISIALIHGFILQRKRGMLKKANLVLAVSYFILVIYSTFLTRSGILSDFSVHSFGKTDLPYYLDSAFYILAGIAILIVVSSYLFIKRFKEIKSTQGSEKIISYDTILAYAVMTLVLFAAIVLVGTSMPILSGILSQKIAVTEKFYNRISVPLGLMIAILIAISVIIKKSLSYIEIAIFGIISIILAVIINLIYHFDIQAFIFTSFPVFILLCAARDLQRRVKASSVAFFLIHGGIAVFLVGVALSSSFSYSETKKIQINEKVEVEACTITLRGFTDSSKSTVDILVGANGKERPASMYYYIDHKTESLYREPLIISKFTGDIYIVPEQYNFETERYTTAILKAGDSQIIGGLPVKFNGFITNNMGTQGMVLRADLLIAGMKYFPGIRFKGEEREYITQNIKGDRIVRLEAIDASSSSVKIYISPEKNAVIPPDSAIFEISFKKFIWIVWLGTLMIIAGFILSFPLLQKVTWSRN